MALFGRRVRIGDLLIAEGLITQQQLETALEEQKIRKTKLGETLLALGYVSQSDFANVLSRQLGIDSVDLHRVGLQDAAIRLVPEDIMKKYELVPFAIDDTFIIRWNDGGRKNVSHRPAFITGIHML